MGKIDIVAAGLVLAAAAVPARAAEPAMVQCGREYQAAKTAGTLGGMDWSAYRAACSARLKGGPAAAAPAAAPQPVAAAAPAATPAPQPMAAAAAPAPPASGGASTTSGGMAAMHARQKQCGAEWRADKAALVAKTPGLTWPRYWSQCNTRLKATSG